MNLQKLKRIMVVEDNMDDQFIIRNALQECSQHHNLHVSFFDGGEQLLDDLNKKLNRQDPLPELIILDLQLSRSHGHYFLFRLKQHSIFKNISVMVLTTSILFKDTETALKLGATRYIVKPSKFSDFVNVLQNLLEQ